MLHCPSGRNDPYTIAAFGVSHVKNYTAAHTKQSDSLFSVILAIVDPLNAKWIAKRRNRLVECNAVIAEVSGSLLGVPFKLLSIIMCGLPVVLSTPTARPVHHITNHKDLPHPKTRVTEIFKLDFLSLQ